MNHRLDIHRGDAEARSFDELSERVFGACIEVHRHLGPGLLESADEECLCHELALQGLDFERQRPLPVEYKGVKLDCGYRLDLVVGGRLVRELKTVERLRPIHEAQLLINFSVPVLKQGLKRIVLNFPDFSAPPRLRG